ncbi:MAG: xylulokinase [Chloroflexi bacterium]|nr:xylulokinase [Chloroflexota bacterium]
MSYLLGIDIGTSGTKALLIDAANGAVKTSATTEYPMSTPQPLWAEQNPADWWAATVSSIRSVLRGERIQVNQIIGIGLTGQMHGLVLLDKFGRVLRPCIMWNDQRTAAQCATITEKIGARKLLDWIANPVLPGFTAPKILWVRENEPQVYSEIAHILLPKDYVRYRLSGVFATEVSDASGTALFDVRQRCWSAEMLASLDIPRSWLPESFESPIVSAKVSADAASETGLIEGTPIVGGGGDQAAQAIGAGIIRSGIISATLGTSGVVFAATEKFSVEPEGRLHTFCHAVPGQWHWMGVMLSAAGSFRWFRDALGQDAVTQARANGNDAYEVLTDLASTASAGSEGLIFLPYLSGERMPYVDPDARGVYFGLTLRHTKAHLVRAVLEGVAYGLRDSLELMRGMGLYITQVRASGGGARSALWRQILADVFDSEIALANVTEGAAYGAALLAGVGVGVYQDVAEACAHTAGVTDPIEPSADAQKYAASYPIYRALYPALAPCFKQLSAID